MDIQGIKAKAPLFINAVREIGFIYPSAHIYGGLRGAWDLGPYGSELRRNIIREWWTANVVKRNRVISVDTSQMTHPSILKASGHMQNFKDEKCTDVLSGLELRTDEAPRLVYKTQGYEVRECL